MSWCGFLLIVCTAACSTKIVYKWEGTVHRKMSFPTVMAAWPIGP